MQVENSSAYTSPLFTRAAHGAENKGGEWASTPAPAQNGETDIANTAKAVTGTTGNGLSSEMMSQLISEADETSVSNTNTEEYDGPLSIGERHHLEDIVNNPGYGASEAKRFGTATELIGAFRNVEEAQVAFSLGEAGEAGGHTRLAAMQKAQGERTAYYESLSGQGLTSAETYAKLLEFNVDLPPSHDATLGWSESGRSMSYSDYNQTRLDYLQNLISQKATDPTSKVTG